MAMRTHKSTPGTLLPSFLSVHIGVPSLTQGFRVQGFAVRREGSSGVMFEKHQKRIRSRYY